MASTANVRPAPQVVRHLPPPALTMLHREVRHHRDTHKSMSSHVLAIPTHGHPTTLPPGGVERFINFMMFGAFLQSPENRRREANWSRH
jgi:hypothetical protein